LLGNPAKAKQKLGWEANISLEDMIRKWWMLISNVTPNRSDFKLSRGSWLRYVDRLRHRILITGASGFVGSALLQLLEREHSVCEVFAFGHGEGQANAVDLQDHEVRPTALVHLAVADARDAPRLARSACGF
jgi:GDP-4-dehydro-6-deoxy-D-mannose reductase